MQRPYLFTADTHGARLTTLVDRAGRPILYPFDGERRGGSHVCLPQFGPDASGGALAQHGFGRTMDWLVDQTDDDIELVLAVGQDDYQGLQSTLRYTIEHDADGTAWFTMRLTLQNASNGPLRVSPGFHPYFATDGQPVQLGGEILALDELASTVFLHNYQRHELVIGNRTIIVESENLPTWAVWTDASDKYICLEPTVAGNSFLEQPVGQHELLAPGEERCYRLGIRVY